MASRSTRRSQQPLPSRKTSSPHPRAAGQRRAPPPSHVTFFGWRQWERAQRLRTLAGAVYGLQWTPGLVRLVLEELHADDDVTRVLGRRDTAKAQKTAEVIAAAVAVRHSWRADDFRTIIRRIRSERVKAQRGASWPVE